MKVLVKKDIHLMSAYNLLIIITGVLFGFMNILTKEADVAQAGSLLAGILLIFIPLNNLIGQEGKTKDTILKSLPIDKRDIVLSRYITMFIYIMFIFGVTFLSSYIFSHSYDPMVVGKPISLLGLLFNVILITIFISIILPIQYLRRKVSSILNLIMYFALITMPLIINNTNRSIAIDELFKSIINIRFNIHPIIMILVGLGIYFISFQISTNFYKSIDR